MIEEANANEGADPAADIRKQNSGETTTADLAGGDEFKEPAEKRAGDG